MIATYKFDLEDRVLTALGDEGIVEMCGTGRAGNQYLVTVSGGKDIWLYEDHLTRKDDGGKRRIAQAERPCDVS